MIRRTKIVATIGPASSSTAVLRDLFAAGVNIARVTLAHGTLESQRALVQLIRDEADAAGHPIGILVDLPGPKVRTTPFASTAELERGDIVTLAAGDEEPSTATRLVVDYETLASDLEVGDSVGIGDGIVHLQIESKSAATLQARVTHGGLLTGRKGFKIPTERFRAPVPTPEDFALIDALSDSPVDIIAVSFVRSAADMDAVRAVTGPSGPWLMAKIETGLAVQNLTQIIRSSDAVMVARGDLGTELPIEEVPLLQKRIIHETVRQGKPVLVATQMLESMIDAPSPTRAEVTDVANAVLDQASAVMLSAETAIGHNPVLVVQTMDRIVRRAEREVDPGRLLAFALENRDLSEVNVATVHAAWQAAHNVNATAILCCTRTGSTARTLSSFRPLTPFYGVTSDPRAVRQLSLCWGVQPFLRPRSGASTEEVMDHALRTTRDAGLIKRGDIVVVLAGSPHAGPGHTDSMRVATVE